MHSENNILLIGTGYMGREYAKVLKAQKVNFTVIGRSKESTENFKKETGIETVPGGIEKWLKSNKPPKTAIIAVTEDMLGKATLALLKSGVKNILVEKPGGFNTKEIIKVSNESKKRRAFVYVGYNRRFYSSTQKSLEIIKQDGGVSSFNFDFTERSYIVEELKQSSRIKNEWFLHNSTHVIDMAFFMGGWPKKITALKKGWLKWHPSGSVYSGTGLSEKGALFSYHADWSSAGRWSIEIMTTKNKLIFRPLEKLQIQKYGSMAIEDVPLDDKLDIDFKPGIYKQVEMFLNNPLGLLTIEEQVRHLETYTKINGYNK